jgi:mannose-6-phosphate isomerase-like protein (cupin superfamily)
LTDRSQYRIHTDIEFEGLNHIDIPALVAECRDEWFNQTLVEVNDSVVRLGIVKGEFHWHHHEDDDEFFLVLSGRLLVDIENETFELGPHQAVTVPKGIRHRTRAPEKTVMLMMAGSGVRPEGDE